MLIRNIPKIAALMFVSGYFALTCIMIQKGAGILCGPYCLLTLAALLEVARLIIIKDEVVVTQDQQKLIRSLSEDQIKLIRTLSEKQLKRILCEEKSQVEGEAQPPSEPPPS